MKVNLKELGFDVVCNPVAFGALDKFSICNHETLENAKIQYVAYDSDEHCIVLKVKCGKCFASLNIFGISFREISDLIVQKLNLPDFINQRVTAKVFKDGQEETMQ
jgi:hypothetical protein